MQTAGCRLETRGSEVTLLFTNQRVNAEVSLRARVGSYFIAFSDGSLKRVLLNKMHINKTD